MYRGSVLAAAAAGSNPTCCPLLHVVPLNLSPLISSAVLSNKGLICPKVHNVLVFFLNTFFVTFPPYVFDTFFNVFVKLFLRFSTFLWFFFSTNIFVTFFNVLLSIFFFKCYKIKLKHPHSMKVVNWSFILHVKSVVCNHPRNFLFFIYLVERHFLI